jgi:hypothetical protein
MSRHFSGITFGFRFQVGLGILYFQLSTGRCTSTRLLLDVSEFVREQLLAGDRCGRELSGSEDNVMADGIGKRTYGACGVCGFGVRVNADT